MKIIIKIVITIAVLNIIMNLNAQSDSSATSHHTDDNFIVGECSRTELQEGDVDNYFFEEYRNYRPDTETLESIKNKIFNYSITIVLGTWCHDSQQQVPRFMKILDNIDYNTNYLKIICVDKEKTGGDLDISMLNIDRVPTFIFYNDGIEVGRIIETPNETLEKDTYNILNE